MSEKNPETAVEAIAMSARAGGARVVWEVDDGSRAWQQFRDLRAKAVTVHIKGANDDFIADGVALGMPFVVDVKRKPPTESIDVVRTDRLRLFEIVTDIIRTLPGCGVTAPDASDWYRDIRQRVQKAQAEELPF